MTHNKTELYWVQNECFLKWRVWNTRYEVLKWHQDSNETEYSAAGFLTEAEGCVNGLIRAALSLGERPAAALIRPEQRHSQSWWTLFPFIRSPHTVYFGALLHPEALRHRRTKTSRPASNPVTRLLEAAVPRSKTRRSDEGKTCSSLRRCCLCVPDWCFHCQIHLPAVWNK